jgi:hypothetical protein
MNRQFGDQALFNLPDAADRTFQIQTSRLSTNAGSAASPKTITLLPGQNGLPASTTLTGVTIPQVVAAIQAQLDADTAVNPTGGARIVVSYDYSAQSLKFTDSTNTIKVSSGSATKNSVLGFPVALTTLTDNGLTGQKAVPNGALERAAVEQRYGMKVEYDTVNKVFTMKSGTTGDQSSLSITSSNATATALLGFSNAAVAKSSIATRGTNSTPGIATGATPTINTSNNFAVDATNNTFVVTVDGIKGTVILPIDSNYSLSTFMSKLEKGINAMGTNAIVAGGTPTTVKAQISGSYLDLPPF